MRVLGIDPGTVRMGYGLVEDKERPTAVDWGLVALPRSLPVEERLYQLYTHVLNMIALWQPEAVAVEEAFVGKGEKRYAGPALAVGQAQAVVLIASAGQGIPVYRYSPAQVKRAIADYGAATKEQVQGDGENGSGPRLDAVAFRCGGRPGHRHMPRAAAPGGGGPQTRDHPVDSSGKREGYRG